MSAATLTTITPSPAATIAAAARPLSPSQVNTYLDCQARWYYSHVAGLPDPPSASAALGRAIHHTAADYLRLRAQGETLTAGDIGDYFHSILKAELLTAELAPVDDPAQLLSDGLAMLAMFTGQIAPQIDAAATEVQVHGQIGGQHVRGIVDVIDQAGVVIDLKTSSKKPASISASYTLQLITYGMLTGQRETRLITLARTKTPSWCQHSLTIRPQHTQYAATVYAMAAESMASGLYLPNRGSNICSRRHCAFWRACQDEYGGSVND